MPNQTEAPFKAWECIGCGRIEAPRPCLGICRDRAVELVHAETYRQLQADNAKMRELILRLARTSPRKGQWQASYQALQERAAELLVRLKRHESPGPESE